MSFLTDVLTAFGAVGIAFALTDLVRSYFPNYFRIAVPVVLITAVDAYVPQFSILTYGWQVGIAGSIAFGMWYLRKRRVIRQDGTVDNG